MSVKNLYPELPELEYKHTTIDMNKVVEFAHSLINKYPQVYLRVAYAIFRNESANGTRGVNNNYAGIQADNAKWTDLPGTPVGTCVKFDSGHQERRFLCFGEDGYKICFELIAIKAQKRGITNGYYYYKSWVGRVNSSNEEQRNFDSMLSQAAKLI